MAGKIYNIEKLTYPEINALDRRRTVIFFAVSPLEEHGPHLPIGVDAMNAWIFACRCAEIVIERDPEYDVLLYPLLPLGTQVYRQPGSFYVKPWTLYEIIYQLGKNLARYGFTNIFVISAHGTPKQIVAIERACAKVSRKYKKSMYCLSGALTFKFLRGEMHQAIAQRLNRKFTPEELQELRYDYHAGWWETSMMLRFHPELVKDSYRSLKPYLKDIISGKIISENKEWQGYTGSPARAYPEFADASLAEFGEIAADLFDRHRRGENLTPLVRSPFYWIPIFQPYFRRNAIAALILAIIIIASLIYLI